MYINYREGAGVMIFILTLLWAILFMAFMFATIGIYVVYKAAMFEEYP